MDVKDFTELGIEKIQEIFDQGWDDIEFIEIVFREWSKSNQKTLDTEYARQMKVERVDGDLDKFSLWLVDNIYLQIYCNGNDNVIVKEFCIKYPVMASTKKMIKNSLPKLLFDGSLISLKLSI